ncbi:hypothetical protein FB474_1470 [Oryzihumus leptocrescens]|uniref:Fibronectin type-III domain-containing protein n=1 Tax=Oryzihumus leptocrescens TaxID=297536 RepID=A0A542ZIC8_9MICO|nr:hypothetical protein FB474_1470 [Oryzihumus leptocrescens]
MRLIAPLLVAAPVLAAGPAAMALSPDPSVQAGQQLPIYPAPAPGYLPLDVGAPGYVAFNLYQRDEYDDPQTVIHRSDDGSIARTVTWAQGLQAPYLAEGGLVQKTPSPDQSGATRVTVTGIETGQTEWTVDVPSSETLVGAGATWVLSRVGRYDSGHAVLRRPGQNPLDVTGLVLGNMDYSVVERAGTLLITDYSDRIWTIDLSTGTLHAIPGSAIPHEHVVMTAQRVYWIDTGNGASAHVYWTDLDGTDPGEATVPDTADTRGWIGYGDGLAVLEYEPGDGLYRAHLEPIDLSTGSREQAVAANVGYAGSVSDGSVAMYLGDTTTGRVATVGPGQPLHEVTELPVVGRQVTALGFSGDRVVAGFGDPYSPGDGPVLTTPADGSGAWQDALADGDAPLPGSLTAAQGNVVLTQSGSNTAGNVTASWPGGHRDLGVRCCALLARGGQVLSSEVDLHNVGFEDVRTGARLATASSDAPYAVDGRTLWVGPNAQGDLVATELGGSEPPRAVHTGLPTCPHPTQQFPYVSLQVAGRFALVRCGDQFTAIDTQGVLAPQVLPWSPVWGAGIPQLGNGFAAWFHQTTDASGTTYVVAQVQNLGPGGGSRLYGPLHGNYAQPQPMLAVNDDGSPRLAYVDTTEQARVVTLDWLTTAPTAWHDATAPNLTSLGGSPRVGGTSVSVSWSYTDRTDVAGELPSQVASYDVRYQQGPIGGAYGVWTLPAQLQGTTDTTAELTTTPGQDACISVRARDHSGNVSDWSASRCSAADPGAPVLQSTGGTPRVNGAREVSFSWSFVDPSAGGGLPGAGLASYDVRYQDVGTTGAPFGPWVYPPVWDHTPSSIATLQPLYPGQGACFQVRARDKAGNLTSWSHSRCSAVDGTSPTVTVASAGPLIIGRTSATSAAFVYRGSDNTAVANYDVGYRYAPPGGTLGALQRPAAWQATTSAVQHVTVPAGGEVCYTVRARDRVGLVSPWAGYRCATVPYDDRALAGAGVSRTSSALALSGTVSRLNSAGATLRAYHQSGAGVAIVVLRGPRQGVLDLYVGTRRVSQIGLSSASWHREVVHVPTAAFANTTITLRSVSGAASLVDALGTTR